MPSVSAGFGQPGPFELDTEDQFDETVAANFEGTFFTIQKALPLLSDNASVIVTTSVSNQRASLNFSVNAVCNASLFLASDDASYITGEEILVDGRLSFLLWNKPSPCIRHCRRWFEREAKHDD